MAAHKRKTVPQGAPNSDINVTPLVDVVLVLLIIFMVMTPLMEKDIEVKVPETEETTEEQVDSSNQLVVEIDQAGTMKLNSEPVNLTDLTDRLQKALVNRKREEKVVFFTASKAAPYPKLVDALDAARRADEKVILGMATEDIPAGAVTNPGDPGAAPAPAPTP